MVGALEEGKTVNVTKRKVPLTMSRHFPFFELRSSSVI